MKKNLEKVSTLMQGANIDVMIPKVLFSKLFFTVLKLSNINRKKIHPNMKNPYHRKNTKMKQMTLNLGSTLINIQTHNGIFNPDDFAGVS